MEVGTFDLQLNRSIDITEEDIENILKQKNSKNTDNVTKYSKNIFTQYMHAKGLDLDTEINNNKLDSTLKNFYVDARTKKGEHYKSTSLIAIRP